jgi:F0F1-type ATP synthase assembly protein I
VVDDRLHPQSADPDPDTLDTAETGEDREDHRTMPSGRDSSGMRFAGIGFELVAAVGALMLLGWWIDRHFGTGPWGLLVGAVVGLVGGMYNMVHEALGATRKTGTTRKTGSRSASPGKPGPNEPGGPESGPPGSGA